MIKKLSITAVIVSLLIALALYFLLHHKTTASPKTPATVVRVSAAKWHSLPLTVSALGQVIAPKTIMVKTKVAGDIVAIYFHEDEFVKQGQPLLRIDDTIAKANLAEKQANYVSLKTQYNRYLTLQKNYPGAVSQDTILQTLQKMKAAQAEMDSAKKALNDTLIRAPFSGNIGHLQATVNALSIAGQSQNQTTEQTVGIYLPAGSPIAILSNTTRVFVQYQVPQTDSRFLKQGQRVEVSSEAYPNDVFHGTVVSISPVVYENSQTYEVIAQINNANRALKSGMKVFVMQTLIPNHKVLVIPGISLVPSLNGYSVYMVEQGKVKAVPVVIQQRHGQWVSIQSGIKAGDRVITDGIGKVQPGTHVVAKS